MKLRALIIDDERPSRDNLKAILVDYFEDIHIIGQAGSVDEALTLLNELNPDLIFLDVQLGPRTGLELLTLFDGMWSNGMLPHIKFNPNSTG